ncbi:MAG TPA: FAD-binding oxidoreductase [Solirubrobacteraceae bacterium]|nr:FAD-binding oxidoreductase [Solirubrobacteraceae bacterium]
MAEREASAVAPRMRWWGWGDPAHASALPSGARGFLAEHVGELPPARAPVALSRVVLEPSALTARALSTLRPIAGEDGVRDDHGERVLHAAGKGYPDLVRLREGRPDGAPDAVVSPRDAEQLRAVIELCSRESIAVVPFGGGTSVVGGVSPLRGEHGAVIALDTVRLDGLVGIDRESRTVTVGGGMRAPALERELARHGLTLGHYPQSFEYVSLGGCAATRSAGQASSGYGAIERMIAGLKLVSPVGEIALQPQPASAAGPSLRQLAIGSEGTLGVISELSLRVREAPRERIYEGVFFEDFAAGVEALRALAQHGASPDVARLSDEAETQMSLALAGSGGVKGRLGRLYLGARGYADGCLAIFGFEGDERQAPARRARAIELVRAHGGLPVGRSPGQAWLAGRFAAPYLRDELMTLGVMVETLETATQWSNLRRLHRAVGEAIGRALRDGGTPGLVMCHVSHLYETGASLYFTLIARQRVEDPLAQWREAKHAASQAIVEHGGTITHHHAVGRDHAPWLGDEIGATGVRALRAVKEELDPAGVMNPGKLLAG